MEGKELKLKEILNKKVVTCMIIAALVISSVAGVAGFKYVKANAKETDSEPITIEVTKQNIEKTLSATGTIISAEESGQFATTTSSYPVEEVYVKVGKSLWGSMIEIKSGVTMDDYLAFPYGNGAVEGMNCKIVDSFAY